MSQSFLCLVGQTEIWIVYAATYAHTYEEFVAVTGKISVSQESKQCKKYINRAEILKRCACECTCECKPI